ncbi:DUF5671 domain-containing protein [Agromyces ramosus]|uniref:DUF5671 domain-containing protein n=1 Tax=Agromyces ramosus TaxID=33879 RepID=A0ABU0R6Z2_9MICO|nr:DUF5671 domain-containing protein [Agromyces ramosus]MDQ0893850.1 hypothetical protein [Agromyces ramosus]
MTTTGVPTASAAPSAGSAQGTVRRLIVYTLLFALVMIAAIGLSGLLRRLLPAGDPLAVDDNAGLALSLAFALIGGTLAALLWWVVWRRLAEESERTSLAWGLYVAAMYTVSLIVATSALVGTATALVDERWLPDDFSIGVVWALVWVWHRAMWSHSVKHPTRLATVPAVLASVYGLVIGVGGAVNALGALFDAAMREASDRSFAGDPWWQDTLEALVWVAAGLAIWWWHWYREGARRIDTRLAAVALVVVGVMGGGLLLLVGLGTTLWVVLRLAFDPSEPTGAILTPLATAVASACMGALVWSYHRRIAAGRSDATRRAGTLVMSGVGLVGVASGIGIIVNSTLAALASPIAASDDRSLLLGGISAVVVGGPVWWLSWQPTRRVPSTELGQPARRVYLVVVFGASAIVGLITLLTVAPQLFEFALDATTIASLVERIRVPLGLLVATGLVFGYHFAVWRRDRSVIVAEGLAPAHRIGRVILVAAGDASAFERAIRAATGASVTVWRRPGDEPAGVPDAAALARALDGVTGKRVLVLAGPGDRVEVVPLAD